MKRIVLVLGTCVWIAGCGSIDLPQIDSLFTRQPRVLAVEPTDGATVAPTAAILVEFSEPLEPATVDATTLAVVSDAPGTTDADLAESLAEGDLSGVAGVYEFEGEGRAVRFRAAAPFEPGIVYRVVATGGIMSRELVPLAQRPGRSGQAFMSRFSVEGENEAEADPEPAGGDAGGDAPTEVPAAPEAAAVQRPKMLVINEILYDVPGDDTNGVLFVELFGDPGASISGYRVSFINGDDGLPTEEILLPQGATLPEDGIFLIADSKTGQSGVSTIVGADFIDNFDPQNGPDCIQLLDDAGTLTDALGYGTPIAAWPENGLACVEGFAAAKPPSGQSLSRTEGKDTGDNAHDFGALLSPTPGVM